MLEKTNKMKNIFSIIPFISKRVASPVSRATRPGFTLIELIIAMSAALVVALIAGTLLEAGHQSWARAYNYSNSQTQLDALSTTISFGVIGRKSNKMDYALYDVSNDGKLSKVALPINPEEVVTGEAVEFHYWSETELTPAILNPQIKGDRYALFYLKDNKLMLDDGPYPPGGVGPTGARLTGNFVDTVTLAQNVVNLEFSHTTRDLKGDCYGCVRMSLTVMDPKDKTRTTITAATLMRNTWP
jgi:prepilin-type N-terminal cleavage/methylation domain-containing protein